MGRDEAYLQQHCRSFGSRSIRVLTSGNHGVGHLETKPADTTDHLKYEQEITRAQARWLKLSSNAKQIFAHPHIGVHPVDEPETVINAIREVYGPRMKTIDNFNQIRIIINRRDVIGYGISYQRREFGIWRTIIARV